MSALPREALEESPLADLHVLAAELGIDGYRRLRKADLIDRIVGAQGGDAEGSADDEVVEDGVTDEDAGTETEPEAEERPARRRGRRGRRRPPRRRPAAAHD